MKVRTIIRRFLLAIFLLFFSAAPGRSETTDGPNWVPVSINAGETYVIENIKPGTKPAFRIVQNANAFLSYDNVPGKLTMLSAESGRWVVTVTNTSDRTVYYDLNAFSVAKPGHPLSPGNLPPSLSDTGLDPRPGAGASPSPRLDMPELATISSLRAAAPSSNPDAAPELKTPSSYDDASWNVPVRPGMGKDYTPNQAAGPLESRSGQYRNNPSVLDSG
ncbi:MAG TPA: hypothetical protein VEO55_01970, partial [Candidatus Dormibacteraeota bacterium]|nr:hypothetical protein [Candidatus Dormibacteraeota bacterium]